MTSSVLRYFYVRCLIFGILPSLVLIFFKNLPSFKIGAYRLVLIKQNACIALCGMPVSWFLMRKLRYLLLFCFSFQIQNKSLVNFRNEKLANNQLKINYCWENPPGKSSFKRKDTSIFFASEPFKRIMASLRDVGENLSLVLSIYDGT